MGTALLSARVGGRPNLSPSKRYLSFSFAGPRALDEIMKKDLLENKTGTEIADIWYTYHETKDSVHGLTYKGEDAKNILSRANSCPFFVQPIFRDDGFFMMISQFQDPSYFFMALLDDYKMDPSAAQPLLTFSVFDDYAESKDLTLVRCDILNNGLEDEEGRKIVQSVLDSYLCDREFATVETFNKRPNSFDVDDFVSRQNEKWRKDPPSVNV
ncbi:F1 complex assembly factor 1 [Seminavis robusta]|uniref:F1 complex assembly factor 1 n=1 Tax=Seminavis robusta TaxID=568900 RepID=A0A9N8DEN9_9STRA|nr:F1 complex assembly factor 1 [Seminavis robusta]|eukprot:Sro59_g034170.1 F1 complex assembly factor 1 (213) ;mRNA; r:63682-64633